MKKSLKSASYDTKGPFPRLAPELLPLRQVEDRPYREPCEKWWGEKKVVDFASGSVVSIEGSVSTAIAAGEQIADEESEIRVL